MSVRKMFASNPQLRFAIAIGAIMVCLGASQRVEGVTIPVDPVPGAGFVDVDAGPLPQILGAPVGQVLEVDFVFKEMKHIELFASASTDIEFGIGNTGNNLPLPYRIVFDLSDENGNLITNEALVVEGIAPAGVIHIAPDPGLTPLPAVIFHDFHVRVETQGDGGLFDLYVAGGAGGTAFVSGPVTFNRAEVGEWIIPEPATIILFALGLIGIGCRRRKRA